MKKTLLLILALLLLAVPAWSGDYDLNLDLNIAQGTFNSLVEEIGTLTAYRALAPAEPQGVTGFDIGVAASFVKIDSDLWAEAMDATTTDFEDQDYLAVPTLRARKGLAFGLDIGASYAKVPDSDVEIIGAELQWALLEGSIATPALALRGSWSSLEGVDDLSLTTYAADAVLSKGFAMLTPYIGLGVVAIDGQIENPTILGSGLIEDYDTTLTRYFGGAQMSLALLRVTADVEYLEQPVYSLKVSLGW